MSLGRVGFASTITPPSPFSSLLPLLASMAGNSQIGTQSTRDSSSAWISCAASVTFATFFDPNRRQLPSQAPFHAGNGTAYSLKSPEFLPFAINQPFEALSLHCSETHFAKPPTDQTHKLAAANPSSNSARAYKFGRKLSRTQNLCDRI